MLVEEATGTLNDEGIGPGVEQKRVLDCLSLIVMGLPIAGIDLGTKTRSHIA